MPQESNFKVTSSYSTVYVDFLFWWKRYLYPSKQAPGQRESWGQLPLAGALYLPWSNFQFFFEFKKKREEFNDAFKFLKFSIDKNFFAKFSIYKKLLSSWVGRGFYSDNEPALKSRKFHSEAILRFQRIYTREDKFEKSKFEVHNPSPILTSLER